MTEESFEDRIATSSLPEGYAIRPPTMADLEPAVDLINACSQALNGTDEHTIGELRTDWQFPGIKLETDMRLVLAPDGQPVGYMAIWDIDEPPVRIWCWGRVHPQHRGLGIGTYLTQWGEERARQAIARAPQDARVVLVAGAQSTDQPALELLDNLGFVETRFFLRMAVELEGPPPEPAWADGITVRTVVPDEDERPIFRVDYESFRDHWGFVEQPFEEAFEQWQHHLHREDTYDPSLLFLAMDGEEIVGMSLCKLIPSEDPDMGWIDSLAVLRPWRRKGIALALLHHTFAEFYRRGKLRVALGADASNLTGAIGLYEKAGMKPIRRFDAYEKELRPGHDLSVQSLEA